MEWSKVKKSKNLSVKINKSEELINYNNFITKLRIKCKSSTKWDIK